MAKPISYATARSRYPHRFTMEHVPAWSQKPAPNGKYYAPQFRTDREWFANTQFPPHSYDENHCYTSNESWPLGQWLDRPYRKA